MSHEYNSPQYFAQKFKEFLGSEEMFRKYGFAFLNTKCGADYVSFFCVKKEFAVRFEPVKESDKLRTYLEVKVEDNWSGVKGRTFEVLRGKKGKVSDRTYKELFGNFVIKEVANYLRTKR